MKIISASGQKGKPEYENIFSDYQKNYEAWTPYAKHRMYLREGIPALLCWHLPFITPEPGICPGKNRRSCGRY